MAKCTAVVSSQALNTQQQLNFVQLTALRGSHFAACYMHEHMASGG